MKGEYEHKSIHLESIDINPELGEDVRAVIIKLMMKYREVFAKFTKTLCPRQ